MTQQRTQQRIQGQIGSARSMRYMKVFALVILWVMGSPLLAGQTCNPSIPRSAPDSRYAYLADGAEVLDSRTSLIWQRCTLGQTWDGLACGGSPATFNWKQALEAAGLAGDGWRLPNQKELRSLVEWACGAPAINLAVFPGTPSEVYWSSSPATANDDYAWFVYFSYGYDSWDYKGYAHPVRLVRAGQ